MTARRKFVAAALVLFFAGVAACAQSAKHESQLKTVRGVVLDVSGNPVPRAVVSELPSDCLTSTRMIFTCSALGGNV